MTTLALINIVLYGVVVYRAARYFSPCGPKCREEDKAVVAAVGVLAFIMVAGQLTLMWADPTWGRSGELLVTTLWAMGISNGVVYLVVINFLSQRSSCARGGRRYFP